MCAGCAGVVALLERDTELQLFERVIERAGVDAAASF